MKSYRARLKDLQRGMSVEYRALLSPIWEALGYGERCESYLKAWGEGEVEFGFAYLPDDETAESLSVIVGGERPGVRLVDAARRGERSD